MNLIERNKIGYLSRIDKYELNNCFFGLKSIPIGVLILYSTLQLHDVEFVQLIASGESDIGVGHEIIEIKNEDKDEVNKLKSLDYVYKVFNENELVEWDLNVLYMNSKLKIAGFTDDTYLGIMSPKEDNINTLPLAMEIENKTYEYNNFDKSLINKTQSKFSLSYISAVKELTNLNKYKDIYNEFEIGMENNDFVFPEVFAIKVEGYTAEYLHKNFNLSELGAYNYLIYLREKPEEALDDLKKGLPTL